MKLSDIPISLDESMPPDEIGIEQYTTGRMIFAHVYATTDEKTRAFMRAIAPYMFDEHGQLKPLHSSPETP